MSTDGSGARRLATASCEDAIPRWVGDGSCIVIDSNRDGDFEIYLMDADGSGQTQLTDDATPGYEPDISLTATFPSGASAPAFLADATAFPTEGEGALLARVPAVSKASCERESAEDRARRAVAGVVCRGGKVTAYYDQFRTRAAMNAYYNRLVRNVDVARYIGTCGQSAAAESTWNLDGVTKGRLLCYVTEDGRAVVVWTHDELHILGFAVRPDQNRAALAKWWAGPKAGPVE